MAFYEPAIEYLSSVHSNVKNYFHRLNIAIHEDVKGWTICLAVLMVTIMRSGITYSFGVFVVQLESAYHRPLAEQNWIGTLSFCISLSCAPVSIAFIRSLKYRGYKWGGYLGVLILSISCLCSSFVRTIEWMFLTHSILYGVGSSLLYMASSLVIGEHFDKHHKYHVLATSILLCGYPIGSLIFNPINAWIVTKFGWRVAFRVASVLIALSGLCCCWTFSGKEEAGMERLEEETEDAEPEPVQEVNEVSHLDESIPRRCCTMAEIKNRPEIVLWYMGNLLSYLGFFMPFLNLAYYMELKKIPPMRSSWALTLLSFAECVTYIFASFMGDYLKGKLVYVNTIAAFFLAIICITWPFMDVSYGVILFISVGMGGFLGLTIVYTYAASGEVTQLPIDIAWSFTNLWSGIGILMGPFFSGAIYDLRQSYDDVFYVVGVLYVLDTIIFAAIPIVQRRRAKREDAAAKLDYNEIAGVISDDQKQTFRVTQRSISKSSLVEGKLDGNLDYGTTANTTTNVNNFQEQPFSNQQPQQFGQEQQYGHQPNYDNNMQNGRGTGYGGGGYGYNLSEKLQ